MISEVNAALRDVLKPHLPARTLIEFGPGQEDAKGKGLAFFLYAMHQDPKGHDGMWSDVRDEDGNMLGRKPPTRRFRLSYLVSAWGTSGEQTAELLDAALVALTTWEDSTLGNGTGPPVGSDVILGIDIAPEVPGDEPWEPWEILKAAHLVARTAIDLVVVAEMVNPINTELAAPADTINLAPYSKDPVPEESYPTLPPPTKRWKRVPRDDK